MSKIVFYIRTFFGTCKLYSFTGYLTIDKQRRIRIDREAIQQASKYDGKWVLLHPLQYGDMHVFSSSSFHRPEDVWSPESARKGSALNLRWR